MKKTLLTTTLLVAIAMSTNVSHAFSWSRLNPATWGTCPKAEKVCKKEEPCKPKCKCKKDKCDPCEKKVEECNPCKKTVTPCNPCGKPIPPCDACDKLQDATER